MKTIVIQCCLLFYTLTAFSQQAVYEFLRTDVGARAAALNGSALFLQNDPTVLFYNPASLNGIQDTRLSFGYFKHLAGINAGNASIAQEVENIGVLAIGILYFDYGTFDRTDISEYVLGTFGASDVAFVMGWATTVEENLFFGINAEYIHSSLADYSSSAVAVGAGISYYIPSQNLTIGGSILHAGSQIKTFTGRQESLPLDVSIGLTKKPEHLPVFLSLVFHRLNESKNSILNRLRSFTFGAEFLMSSSLRLRVGYNNEQRRDLKFITKAELVGFSFGGGLIIKDYTIDYAYNSYGTIGGLHQFSVGMHFE